MILVRGSRLQRRASSAPHRIAWGEDEEDVTADFAKPPGTADEHCIYNCLRGHERHPCHNESLIHLRVVSPSDVTSMLMPALRTEQAVMNLTLHPAAASNPDGDAVHFDVLNGAANDVIGRLRDLGLAAVRDRSRCECPTDR